LIYQLLRHSSFVFDTYLWFWRSSLFLTCIFVFSNTHLCCLILIIVFCYSSLFFDTHQCLWQSSLLSTRIFVFWYSFLLLDTHLCFIIYGPKSSFRFFYCYQFIAIVIKFMVFDSCFFNYLWTTQPYGYPLFSRAISIFKYQQSLSLSKNWNTNPLYHAKIFIYQLFCAIVI
jgi:hypothetical protein